MSRRPGRPCGDYAGRAVQAIQQFAAHPDIGANELHRRIGGNRADALRLHRALRELREALRSR